MQLLLEFEDLVDSLRKFHANPILLDLKEGTELKHLEPLTVAIIHETTLQKELERFYKIAVLYKHNTVGEIPVIYDI